MLGQHAARGTSSIANGLRNGSHHTGSTNVGTYVHHNLVQNYNYGHHHHSGSGGNRVGGQNYRYQGYGYGGYGPGGFGLGGYGGYRPSSYGFGIGLGRFGYGWGSGLGNYYSGWGGYPRWGCFAYQPVCLYQPYGYMSGYGYGGYGYGGGYGYPGSGYGPYASLGLAGYGNSAYGYGAGYAPVAQTATLTDSIPVVVENSAASPSVSTTQVASGDSKSAIAGALPSPEEYAQIGETAFKSRDYKSAVRAWRHGLVDDPENGVLTLMLAQALFAAEQFNEAAGATQFGMQVVPKDKWEIVVKNYRELYGKVDDYTTQLRTLEKAAKDKPDDPALRFLLGYHYGFLGYPKEAVQQLEKCITLAPQDEAAQKLLDLFGDKLPKKGEPPAPGKTPEATSLPPLNPAVVPPPPPAPSTSEPSTAIDATQPANTNS